MFDQGDCSHGLGLDRYDARSIFAHIQYIIGADALGANFRDEDAVFTMSLADQAIRRTGQSRCTNIVRGEISYALTLDHGWLPLAFEQRIGENGRLHYSVPPIQVIPRIDLGHPCLLRSTDRLIT